MSNSPAMSASERAAYSRARNTMDYFHSQFRTTYQTMYKACETGKRPQNMSIRQFLDMVEHFCQQLTLHHTLEEARLFPALAKRMPAFRQELELLTQHNQIHQGLERLEKYTAEVRASKRDFRMADLKDIFDSFGQVLWSHLDDEVAQLHPDNMRKFWSVEEVERLPL